MAAINNSEVMERLKGLQDFVNMLNGDSSETKEISVGRQHLTIKRSKEKQIVVPEDMPIRTVIKSLESMERDENRVVEIHHRIVGFPLDGAVAFNKALMNLFGFVEQRPTPGFFGSQPPRKVSVRTGPGIKDVVQVPWGRVSFAMLGDGYLELYAGPIGDDGVPSFIISGEVKKKHEKLINEVARATEALVRTESIYAGKALRLNLDWIRNHRNFNPEVNVPQFMNLTGRRDLIFPRATQSALDASLYHRITDRRKNDQLGIDVRTGVLLVGDYGTGKTEVTMDLAQVATDSDWTFFVVGNVLDLPYAVQIANLYATEGTGAVVFAEDVDQANEPEVRNAIQYALDGAQSKETDRNTITVLTTNHVNNIDPALLRPGRMDDVITLGAPDGESAERFIRRFVVDAQGNSLIPEGEDVSEAANLIAEYEYTPAFVRECIRQSLAMAQADENGNYTVGNDQLVDAVKSKLSQWQLLQANKGDDPVPTVEARIAENVLDILEEDLGHILRNTYNRGTKA